MLDVKIQSRQLKQMRVALLDSQWLLEPCSIASNFGKCARTQRFICICLASVYIEAPVGEISLRAVSTRRPPKIKRPRAVLK